ncbi:Integrase core domain-containing protein [Melghirimyces thermohalophilus]|uniref:Integrase core domain-containing protein n=1 Tax=Melghirimyces thermohalophilus TaxID=1236220 RepID=A0A1G6R0K7_9BACL|nr:IS3 family transposase [Melghirimyces thermohalophilus]SDC97527.1 Integrase core domain-containing protein [Melghirimyces thermohalophilus]
MELDYTPTYASWLNRIECHFSPLHKFVLEGSNYLSHDELIKAIQEYIRWWNKNKRHATILREQNKIKIA